MAENTYPEATGNDPAATGDAETAHVDDGDTVVPAQGRFQRLGDDVQNRYRRVSEDVRRGAERARDELNRGTERARETYRTAADTARQRYDQIRSDAGNLTREVGAYVRENPAKALLMAAGVGFLLGLLVRRNDDDEDEE
jgi:ElaB/YqjD/DUF883 family membrane-anchored ribosome-binding protein